MSEKMLKVSGTSCFFGSHCRLAPNSCWHSYQANRLGLRVRLYADISTSPLLFTITQPAIQPCHGLDWARFNVPPNTL